MKYNIRAPRHPDSAALFVNVFKLIASTSGQCFVLFRLALVSQYLCGCAAGSPALSFLSVTAV